MQKLKNLVIPGIAGILLACAIFSAFVMVPWTPTSTSPTPPYGWSVTPTSPITVNLTISEFTEPQGPGSEANLTIFVMSKVDLSNVLIEVASSKSNSLWPSEGIELVGGNLFWIVNLTTGIPITFSVGVNATEVGYVKIEATAEWSYSLNYQPSRDLLGIVVLEDEIQVWEDIHGSLPFLPPPDYEPPIWPSPPPENFTGP